MQDLPRPFWDHFADLRDCLLKAFGGWLLASALCFQFGSRVLDWLIRPPLERLVFTSPAEPFFAYFKVAFFLGFLLAFPWILYQTWRFISIAMKPGERRLFWELLPVSYGLFLGGSALGVFVICPTAIRFLFTFASDRIVPYITLNSYLSFIGYTSIGLGMFFQFPVVLFVLAGLGVIRPQSFDGYRRHIFLGLLIAATIISSGSVVDQAMIAVISYGLFELSLLAIRIKGFATAR